MTLGTAGIKRAVGPEEVAMIDAVFAQKDRDEWEEIFKAQDVWHQPVLSAAVRTAACKRASHDHVFCSSLGCPVPC